MGDPLPFHVMAKPVGPACNLGCKYCFYLEKQKLYPETRNWAMAPQVLESYIRQYIEAQPGPSVTFAWQGGEPTLLGIDFFRKVIELQRRYGQGKSIQNTFQTNGVLLNDSWAEFFVANDFLVGVSIDGPRELHDRYRVEKDGQPAFDKVMNGIGVLKKHAVQFNLLTAVNRANSEHPTSVYRLLKEVGSGYIQFIPIVERAARTANSGMALVQPSFQGEVDLAPWSVSPTAFGRFLCTIFDQWIRQDVGQQFVQIFDVALEIWYGMKASLCVFGETCGRAVALEHTGDLYSCDHFVYPENKLGNIIDVPLQSMMVSEQQQRFGANKRDKLPHQCKVCDVRFACNGACPKHRFLSTPDGEPGLNYLCAGYKAFFHHIDPYMKFMAAELRAHRAPANVMTYVAQQDMLASGRPRPRRNDLCPCGSGRKYKRCCGVSE